MKLIKLMIISAFLLVSCTNYGQLEYLHKLPGTLKENSGMEVLSGSTYWFINDAGNKDHLYGVNKEGKIVRDINIKNAKNEDWEDLTKDNDGNIYIGNFGNNKNDRKDLSIYKVPNPETNKGDELEAEKIAFYFPGQEKFPPKKKNRVYDVEAFFYLKGNLYLFTRNRSSDFDGTTRCYRIPAKAGKHETELLGTYSLCDDPKVCQVTSAAISPDNSTVVLLGHDSVWTFTGFKGDYFLKGKAERVSLGHFSQKESVCFLDNTTLLISDEKNGAEGQNLYAFKLKK